MKTKISSKKWFFTLIAIVIIVFLLLGTFVYITDPFFHYHKPYSNHFFYRMASQRNQNDGIVKHFDYDAVITGSSMNENFKASEADKLFGASFIKTTFSGATYKETADLLDTAFKTQDIKYVINSLDNFAMLKGKDELREDQGEYPTYLYDDNIINDIKYLLNKDVIVSWSFPMVKSVLLRQHGITSFDEYSNWNATATFGKKAVADTLPESIETAPEKKMTKQDRQKVIDNVNQNIVRIAKEHPKTEFYYFFPPYSYLEWGTQMQSGTFEYQKEAIKIAAEQLVQQSNIHVFFFSNLTDITTNLDNYKDSWHYGEKVNSMLLAKMKNGENQLSKTNVQQEIDSFDCFYKDYCSKNPVYAIK